MKIINVARYESFNELYNQYLEQKKDPNDLKSLIFLFVASDEPQTNQSWCSDCRASKPVIDKTIETFQFNEQIILSIVQVGMRDDWKRPDNPFRTHPLQISAVPTLLSIKNAQAYLEQHAARKFCSTPMMAILNPHQSTIVQSLLAFIVANQAVHYYLNPLADVDRLTQEKKSELWENYLRNRDRSGPSEAAGQPDH